jgi:hypothetical protein
MMPPCCPAGLLRGLGGCAGGTLSVGAIARQLAEWLD